MPDNKNPPKNEEEKISRVGEEIECQNPRCKKAALSLSLYCWEHIEDKEEYRIKIDTWAAARNSMRRFILKGADLSNLMLMEANLAKALLEDANLSGTTLYQANMSEAWFAGADLRNARLNWAKFNGAIGLTRENFNKQLTKEEKKAAGIFRESYLTLKNNFSQSGRYDDASWAAFRERTLERIARYIQIKKRGIKGLFSLKWWKAPIGWFGSKFFSLISGYGERYKRVFVSWFLIIIAFFIFYLVSGCIVANPPETLHWWDYLYFSIVTFTTLGYGDIRPLATPWARMVASGEAFIGAFMIALFVWTLARKYVAR